MMQRALSACVVVTIALASVGTAHASPKPNEAGNARQHAAALRKLDRALHGKSKDKAGATEVIVEFVDTRDDGDVLQGFGPKGRRLNLLNARVIRVPNALLERLAANPRVKKISFDRPASGDVGRTAATIGSRAVVDLMGYTGAGIGVAVIDSGITGWHDDMQLRGWGVPQPSALTLASTSLALTGQRLPANQRLAHFKDFVNGRTAPYDDWGHGTHVAGIIAGNGYDAKGTREAIAPGAHIVSLKALDGNGSGTISNIIAAIEYAIAVRHKYNIRILNMSLGAGVFESYHTDPLTQAAKRAVEAGIVVIASAGNLGKSTDGSPQYGAIGAPGNAPWVLTVGASSTNGTTRRQDDTVASYSSRGPTMIDFAAKPDLVAPGTGTIAMADPLSRMYGEKAQLLVSGSIQGLTYKPYLTLSGTSMAAPVVAGTVALMLHANPSLTPNMVKAILQFTAQVYPSYDALTQGAGFLNARGAVVLAEYFREGRPGARYPKMNGWSRHIFWGNRRVSGGVLTPNGTAWATNIVWGESRTPGGQNIVWGENCATSDCHNIVWGTNIVWGESLDTSASSNNIVWGESNFDNVVWGYGNLENIVWADGSFDNIVWGQAGFENIVWGQQCEGADCANTVWGQAGAENVVWGQADRIENIVWGQSADNIVWGQSGLEEVGYGDDAPELGTLDSSVWDNLFEVSASATPSALPTSPVGGGLQ